MSEKHEHTQPTAAAVIGIMRKLPPFAGLQDDEYRAFFGVCRVQRFERGSVLFHEGAPGYEMFVLLSGSVEIRTEHAGRIHTMSPGELLGEIAVVMPTHRSATAVAVEDTWLLQLGRDDLDVLVGRAPRTAYLIMRNIARTLGERLLRANDRLPPMVERHYV